MSVTHTNINTAILVSYLIFIRALVFESYAPPSIKFQTPQSIFVRCPEAQTKIFQS